MRGNQWAKGTTGVAVNEEEDSWITSVSPAGSTRKLERRSARNGDRAVGEGVMPSRLLLDRDLRKTSLMMRASGFCELSGNGAPPQARWHLVTVKHAAGQTSGKCNGRNGCPEVIFPFLQPILGARPRVLSRRSRVGPVVAVKA